MTRRRFLAGMSATAAASATVLAACGASPRAPTTNAQPGAQPAGAATPSQSRPVQFMNWDPVEGTSYEAVIKAYEQQTGRRVEIIPTPGSGTEYETKVRAMLAGGNAPDIMRTNDDYVRYYSSKQQVVDLSAYIKRDIKRDDYSEAVLDFPIQPDGRNTAWSVGTQPRLIFYNVTMFKEAGVPLPPKDWVDTNWKWANFLDAAKKLTKGNERWGALVYTDTGFEQIWPTNNGHPSGIYSKDGKQFTLADPKAAEAIQWVVDLTCKHQVQPERGLVRQSNAANGLFAAGKIGMFESTAGVNEYFRRNIPKPDDPAHFAYDVAPIPGNVAQRTTASLILFTVTKSSKDPAAAWELLKYMASLEAGKIFADRGTFVPVNKQAASMLKVGDQPPASYPANIALFSEALNHLTFNSLTNNTEGARNIYRAQLDTVYNCQISAQELLNKVKKDTEEVLAGDV